MADAPDNSTATDPNDQAPPPSAPSESHESRLNKSAIEKARLEERNKLHDRVAAAEARAEAAELRAKAAQTAPQTATPDPADQERRITEKFTGVIEGLTAKLAEIEQSNRTLSASILRERRISEEMARTGGQLIPEMITSTDPAEIEQQIAASHSTYLKYVKPAATPTPDPGQTATSPQSSTTQKPIPPSAVSPADSPTALSRTTRDAILSMTDEEYAKNRPALMAGTSAAYRKQTNPVLRPR